MKNKYIVLTFITNLCLLFSPYLSTAQSLEDIKKKYSDAHAVMLTKSLHYNISLLEGKPHVESDEIQQIEYLNNETSRFMSQYGFFHSDFQQVVAYEAFTRTAKDKKLKVSDFKTNDSKEDFVFYDDSKETTFDFPAVSEGAIGNLHVSWVNNNPYLLSPFYFQNQIPTLNSELRITFPKDMVIKYQLMGLDTNQVILKIEKSRHEYTYTFSYQNCPALKAYGDAPGRPWYATHVIFYIDSYKDEAGKTIRFLSNLEDLYRLNYSYLKSINATPGKELKYIVDSLTGNTKLPEEKARNIYSWVQQHIKYVAFEQGMEGFIPRDATVVCNRRFGDCKDMSSILTVMLRIAGIPAYYTWIGTRDLPYSFTQLPLPMVSNHMICTILLNGKYIFLDGTDPTCIFGFPSRGIQDKEAMMAISDNEYKILKVPIIDKKANTLTDSTWLELTPAGMKGSIKKCMTGYFSMHMHGTLMYTTQSNLKQEMKENFSRGSNKFQLDTFQIASLANPDSVLMTASFSLPDYAKKLGNEWYLNLNLFKFYEHEEIDYPKRKMPIEYNFQFIKEYVTLIRIPEGYQVEAIPQGKSYHNDIWGFDFKYEQKGNLLILTQYFDNNKLLITNDQFEGWNKVLENLYPLYKETLSFSKTNTK